LFRLGLTVGRAPDGALPHGGTVAAWSAPNVLVPLPEHERRIAQESVSGIPYRDRGLVWTRKHVLQYHERLAERMRRRGLPARLRDVPEPAAAPPDPSQEDACA
jgi:hypothetical protein